MPLSNYLHTLLDNADIQGDWHHHYGLTVARKEKFCGSKRDSNSFLNPHSETALTLFMLGKLDNWFQPRSELPLLPRAAAGWNNDFFQAVAENDTPWRERPMQDRPLVSWAADISGCDRERAKDAILLFELEVRNSALAKNRQLCPVSFLNVCQSWCQFDAVILLPTKHHLIFVESKLASDMSRDTAYLPFVSQAIRGWESAFLLTRSEQSLFRNWTFTNVLLCPRKPFEYQTAYYAYVFSNPREHVAHYRNIIKSEYTLCRPDTLFEEFYDTINDLVKVAHWDELAQRSEPDTAWISGYLARLRHGCGDNGESAYEAATRKFQLAGIDIPYACR